MIGILLITATNHEKLPKFEVSIASFVDIAVGYLFLRSERHSGSEPIMAMEPVGFRLCSF